MLPGPVAAGKVFQYKEVRNKNMANDNEIIDNIANKEYEFGFVTDIEMDVAPAGLGDSIEHVGGCCGPDHRFNIFPYRNMSSRILASG